MSVSSGEAAEWSQGWACGDVEHRSLVSQGRSTGCTQWGSGCPRRALRPVPIGNHAIWRWAREHFTSIGVLNEPCPARRITAQRCLAPRLARRQQLHTNIQRPWPLECPAPPSSTLQRCGVRSQRWGAPPPEAARPQPSRTLLDIAWPRRKREGGCAQAGRQTRRPPCVVADPFWPSFPLSTLSGADASRAEGATARWRLVAFPSALRPVPAPLLCPQAIFQSTRWSLAPVTPLGLPLLPSRRASARESSWLAACLTAAG